MRETFEIEITKDFSLNDLKHGLFIFMFRATRIPPHLGIITNGKLYDISLKGPNIDVPVEDFISTVNKRASEVVFIELNKPQFSSFLDDEIKYLVNKYWKVSNDVSCLAPIKDFLEQSYGLNSVQKAEFVFDLLPILKENSLIKSTGEVNLYNKLNNNKLELSVYSKKDIENCMNALNRKEQQAC